MKSFTVVGYAYDGTIYCVSDKPDVPEDDLGVVFADSEGWEEDVCDVCGEKLEDAL